VGASTDTYALGSVLYEMLVGDPPFAGSTAQAVLGKIIAGKRVSATEERASVPANVDAAIRKALEKLPADRFTSAQEFVRALGDEHFRYGELATAGASAAVGPWNRLTLATTGLAVVFGLAAAWGWLQPSPTPSLDSVPFRTGLTDFDFRAPDASGARLAISSDGLHIAVASYVDGVSMIFLRRSDQREFLEIPGTEAGLHPTFSPNGEWLAFQQAGEIKRVEVPAGPILRVADGAEPHWGLDETIVFGGPGGGIYQVSPFGGDPVFIVEGTSSFARPHLLPDGKAVLFQGADDRGQTLMLVEIESGEVVNLGVSGSNPRYIPTGHLVYGHETQVLMAVPFDLSTHRVTGTPATALPDVLVYARGATQFAVSETGTAVYGLAGSPAGGLELVIVDLDGVATVLPLGEDSYRAPRFSPNGRRIAYDLGNRIWVYDRDSGANPPLTTGGVAHFPVWSRDGRYLYFESARDGTLGPDVFRQLADGPADAERLFRRDGPQFPLSTSPDGTQLLVGELTADRGWDLQIMSEGQDSAIFTDYLVADWQETMGTISPDGERVAYVSDRSNIREVYVRSFPEGEDWMKVSEGGGTEPIWALDETAIYYLNGSRVMRASVTTGGFGEPQMLFEGSWTPASVGFPMTNWDVHPDGTSFVFVRDPEAEAGETEVGPPIVPLELVTNWFEELRQRMGN